MRFAIKALRKRRIKRKLKNKIKNKKVMLIQRHIIRKMGVCLWVVGRNSSFLANGQFSIGSLNLNSIHSQILENRYVEMLAKRRIVALSPNILFS